MRSLLIRCYPARWRARYGDEFEAVLDERPLGPFDVADILLGAMDARLRMHGRPAADDQGRGFTMTLRIGGIAAILGAGLLVSAAISTMSFDTERFATALAVAGMLALLVALVGVSAFQARIHPRLVWTAFGLCVFATITNLIGVLGLMRLADLSGPGEVLAGAVFVTGVFAGLVGFSLFGVATLRTGVLSRSGAILLAIAPFVWLVAFVVAMGDWALGGWLLLVAVFSFVLGWLILGIQAIRLDQPAIEARPA
jgi:hypothetical protein